MMLFGRCVVLSGVVASSMLGLYVSVRWRAFHQDHIVFERRLCQVRLRALEATLSTYTDDYDGVYPPANTWAVALEPYAKSPGDRACPAVADGQAVYAANTLVFGRSRARVQAGPPTALLWDSIPGVQIGTNPTTAARRHLGAANVLWTNGTICWGESILAPPFGAPFPLPARAFRTTP